MGGASYLLGLSFVHPDDDQDVMQFSHDSQQVLGGSLDAFVLGNVRKLNSFQFEEFSDESFYKQEPDLYAQNHKRSSDYNFADYVRL